MNISKLRKSKLANFIWYDLGVEVIYVYTKGYNTLMNRAIITFVPEEKRRDRAYVKRLKNEMRKAYRVCRAIPLEFFLWGLEGATKEKMKSFVTLKYMFEVMIKRVGLNHYAEVEDKFVFAQLAAPYFHRSVVPVRNEGDWESFKNAVLQGKRMIFKSSYKSCGKGVFVKEIQSESEARETFDDLLRHGANWVVEDCIVQCQSMAEWNSSSVNTIRISSCLVNGKFNMFTSCFRIGRQGAIVDNAGSGGVACNVDSATGLVITDGVDEYGNHFTEHPDSHKVFKGYQVPRWDEAVKMVEEMHRTILPNHCYIGWDLALTENGWVLIEANWGRFLNQYVDQVGRRKEFDRYLSGK